jgi:hypothetical protein
MKTSFLVLIGPLLINIAFGSTVDQKKYDLEREILNSLIKRHEDNVDTRSCNLKKARVADFLSHFILLASLPEVEGRKNKFVLNCEDRSSSKLKYADNYNCYLKAGEAIRLPNEPEGWERRLQFNFDFKAKQVRPKDFRCVDIP